MKTESENKIKEVNVAISKKFDSEVMTTMYNAISTLFNLRITGR